MYKVKVKVNLALDRWVNWVMALLNRCVSKSLFTHLLQVAIVLHANVSSPLRTQWPIVHEEWQE